MSVLVGSAGPTLAPAFGSVQERMGLSLVINRKRRVARRAAGADQATFQVRSPRRATMSMLPPSAAT